MFKDFATINLQRKLPLIRWSAEVFVNILRLRLKRLLSHTVLGRVPCVSGLNRTTTHTSQTTPLSRRNLLHSGINPNTSLILHNKRDTLTKPRSGLRRDNINPTTTGQANEFLTRPGDHSSERTSINHRAESIISVLNLVLSSSSQLNKRSRPLSALRLTRLILTNPPTTTTMLIARIHFARFSKPIKHDRPNTLSTNERRNQRRLPPLLSTNQRRTTMHKRCSKITNHRGILHRIMVRNKHELFILQHERVTLSKPVRHNTMSLNPVSNQEPESQLRNHCPPPSNDHAPKT